MSIPDFYLTSSEGHLPSVNKCFRIKRLRLATQNDLLLIRVEPPLLGRQYALSMEEIDKIVIASRHRGLSLFPITKWPTAVYVLALFIDNPETTEELKENEYKLIAWADVYKTELAAIARSYTYP